MRFAILPILFLAFPASAIEPLTDPAKLLPHLGVNGTSGVGFSFTTEVVRTRTPSGSKLLVKSSDVYFILRDGTLPNQIEDIQNGDIICVRGKTEPFPRQPDYIAAFAYNIKVIGHTRPEPPVETSITDIINGQFPFRLIRVQGVICDVFQDEIDHCWQHFILSSGHASLGISAPVSVIDQASANALIGAKVAVTGISQPFSTGYRRVFGTEIEVRASEDIQIIAPAPQDPFLAPPLSRVRHPQASEISTLSRHHTEGYVIAIWNGDHVAMRCPDGNLVNITLSEASVPAYGDYIEAVGLPETDLYRVNLKRAIWRRKTNHCAFTNEVPVLTTASDIFTDGNGHSEINPDFHGKAITLTGTVIDMPLSGNHDPVFHLKCDRLAIKVDASAAPQILQHLAIGSTVKVSGTCVVRTNAWHPNEPIPRIDEILLAVRTPTDLLVLSTPPWWTKEKLLFLCGSLLAGLFAILLWNVLLQRLADKKSNQLATEKVNSAKSQFKIQERTRIAVELHDTIAQNLTGVSLEIDAARQLAGNNTASTLAHLSIAANTLQSCRNELRNCLWDLRSQALEESDLNEAIRRAIAPQVSDVNLVIRFNVNRKDLSDDIAHVLMRIVRELTINATRHGKATTIRIAGSLDQNTLSFSVRDNGKGFDPDDRPGILQGHFGLQGIRERVNQFDDTMHLESKPGSGTKVTITLAIPPNQTAYKS